MEQAPDLDGRPGEPTRSTLAQWLQTCRRCHAAAPDLQALPAGTSEVVKAGPYRALSGPAAPFVRWAMLCESDWDKAEAMLQAAWALDDAGGDAAPLRLQAATLWGEPDTADQVLRQADVLRRAGAFDQASRMAARLDGSALDENSAAILRFQQERIAARDAGRHGIGSALRPPARRPHAAHGSSPGAKPGLLQRLFGR